jgi:hypothetical protein
MSSVVLCGALFAAGCPDGDAEDALEETGETIDEAVDDIDGD